MAAGSVAAMRQQIVADVLAQALAVYQRFLTLDQAPIVRAADAIILALERGGKVIAFGNGGSAADAQHLTAELVGRFTRDRRPLAAIALSTDSSVVTSVANDYGYEAIFARQIEALGRPGDVAVGISTSGASPNVIAGLQIARSRGLSTIAVTGSDGGSVGRDADIHVNVPDRSAARVQEVHRIILHALCEVIERAVSAPDEERTGA